jgi:hypothetical protein
MMVTEHSAERITEKIRGVLHLPMQHTDHRGLVRFDDPYDTRYSSLRDKIENQAGGALGEVHKRPQHIEGQQPD